MDGPCEWDLAGADGCDAIVECGYPQQVKAAAVDYLWRWTGKRFGLCDVTVRPCRRDCDGSTTYRGAAGRPDRTVPTVGDPSPFVPALIRGAWRNVSCFGCGDACSCETTSALVLPAPVADVVEVAIDGEVIDSSAYRVDGRARLVRQDGGSWPTCQDLSLPDGEPGTWSVRYRHGTPVPEGGQVAAAVLACEMAKALMADKTCGLPQRITNQVTREGITVTILDQFEGLEAGRTGLWLVDSWVMSIRQPNIRSGVFAPGLRRTVSRTSGGS